jgi:hypothetical protein
MLDADHQTVVVDQMCHAARMAAENICAIAAEPFTRLRPALYPDGDQWCALYGENLQEGVAGFDPSPYDAEQAFNKA